LARERYRQLQTALVALTEHGEADRSAPLVAAAYGRGSHPHVWAERTARILARAAAMNRAVLGRLRPEAAGTPALHALAEVLPPLALVDFARVAAALGARPPGRRPETSAARYRSLFAEILGLEARGQW
jgi:hypothetical protein